MLDKVMNLLLTELNSYLSMQYPSTEPHVVLSPLSNPDGTLPREINQRLILSFVNLERETAAASMHEAWHVSENTALKNATPLPLNLYFLIAANYSADSAQALKILSAAIGYLQAYNIFTPSSSAQFPKGLEKLTVELVNLNLASMQNLWAFLGVKYIPSALYKARMVTLLDQWVTERVPVVTSPETRSKP
jgi:hypothetical protein